MHQRCHHCHMKKGHFVVHFSTKNQSMSFGIVGTCREFVGTCRDLSGMWILWNLTLRESQLWSIKFRPNSLFPRFCGLSLMKAGTALNIALSSIEDDTEDDRLEPPTSAVVCF